MPLLSSTPPSCPLAPIPSPSSSLFRPTYHWGCVPPSILLSHTSGSPDTWTASSHSHPPRLECRSRRIQLYTLYTELLELCIIRINPVYNDCHFGGPYRQMVALSWLFHTQDHYGYRGFTICGTTETQVVVIIKKCLPSL